VKPLLRFVEAADEKEATRLDGLRVRGIDPISVPLQRFARGLERARRPGQVACRQRDLGLRHDALRAGHLLPWAERARGVSQQRPRALEIAQLRHRDASERQRRGVVSQGHALQRAQRIASGERARRGDNE
jgi:hypothetical protein